MNKNEITRFILLLTTLISICFGLAGVAALLSTLQINNDGYKVLYDTISAISSIISSVVAVFGLLLAISGINTWKKQLRFGKHLSIIWESKQYLRELQSSRFKWYIYLYAFGTNELTSDENLGLEEKIIEKNLEHLTKSFSALDTIVVKNQWQWVNYAISLKQSISEISKILKDNRKNSQSTLPLIQKLTEQNKVIDENFKFIETQLERLESEYS